MEITVRANLSDCQRPGLLATCIKRQIFTAPKSRRYLHLRESLAYASTAAFTKKGHVWKKVVEIFPFSELLFKLSKECIKVCLCKTVRPQSSPCQSAATLRFRGGSGSSRRKVNLLFIFSLLTKINALAKINEVQNATYWFRKATLSAVSPWYSQIIFLRSICSPSVKTSNSMRKHFPLWENIFLFLSITLVASVFVTDGHI